MERRKPPEEKRRAIENLLSRDGGDATRIRKKPDFDDSTKVRKVRQRSFELGDEQNPFEVEKPDDAIEHGPVVIQDDEVIVEAEPVSDDYAPTGYGGTAEFDDDEPPPPLPPKSNGARNAIIIAAVILFIGAGASALILAREQIMSLFTGTPPAETDGTATARITKLEKENADLLASLGSGEQTNVELGNLRSANASLQQSLDEERQRVSNLQSQLDTFKNADPTDNPQLENALNQVEKLQGDLNTALTNITELQGQIKDANSRMVNYTRENSRLNQELESAKRNTREISGLRRENERLNSRVSTISRELDTANSQITVLRSRVSESEGSNSQLTNVNNEYRRVLGLLQESREANNHKQDRIDELLAENGKLRDQVTGLQRRTDTAPNTRLASNTTRPNNASSGVTSEPTPIEIVRPKYPASAMRRKVSGTVELRVLVSEKGAVLDARVVRSPDRLRTLDRAALSAVRKWRFNPAMRDGKAVQAWHKVPMEFTLSRDDDD